MLDKTGELLLETVHGSHLYGLAHPGSDRDTYRVWAGKRKMRQNINGDDDVTNKSLEQFLKEVYVGVPQALEALWSPVKTVNKLDFLTLRPGYADTVGRYLRTVKSFWTEDLKKRRHSARLYLNLEDYMAYGHFNPRLTEEQKDVVQWFAENSFYYPRL